MREFLRLTKETTYGVFPTSPAAGTQMLVSLPSDNSFTVRKMIDPIDMRSAGADNRRVKRIVKTYKVGGGLKTLVRPSQATLLGSLATGITGGNCKTLPSFTCDHGFYLENSGCTVELRRYMGCMMDLTLTASNTAEGTLMMADATIIGQSASIITGTDFPTPADTDLGAIDNEAPYAFQDCTGALTIGSVRTLYSSWSFHFGNKLITYPGEGPTIGLLAWRSRDPSVTISNLYTSPQDRIDYEAAAAKAVSFTFTEGTASLAFALGAANYFDAPKDDLKVGDGFFMQEITLQNFVDPATGTDFTLTVVAPT